MKRKRQVIVFTVSARFRRASRTRKAPPCWRG